MGKGDQFLLSQSQMTLSRNVTSGTFVEGTKMNVVSYLQICIIHDPKMMHIGPSLATGQIQNQPQANRRDLDSSSGHILDRTLAGEDIYEPHSSMGQDVGCLFSPRRVIILTCKFSPLPPVLPE
jgi:hypothetical protein